MAASKQLVRRVDYNYEDFLGLLISAEDLTAVLVISGFWKKLKSILCVIHYVDGLNRLWYFDCTDKRKKYVDLYRLQAFGVLCDVPQLEESDNVERD
jgi:hypothetical protein